MPVLVRRWYRVLGTAVLCLLATRSLSAQSTISDNSFLIEEAYNQESGVVQHISTFSRPDGGGAWDYAFTQEWPLGGMIHQLSYTLPVVNPEGGTGTGIGDIALNYRYQLVARESADGATAVHVAPRATLLLPTGSESEGRGTGELGVQANLPVSWVVSPKVVTHYNAGVTVVGSAADFNLGASAVYRLRRSVNLLLEALWLDPDGFYLNDYVAAGEKVNVKLRDTSAAQRIVMTTVRITPI